MKYNIPKPLGELNEKNYVNKLINCIIHDEKDLIKYINNCLMNQMSKEENLVEKPLKEEGSINEDDIDMITIIKRYLSNYYKKKLNYLYFRAEQDQFFSTILSKYELDRIKKAEEANQIKDEDEDGEQAKENNENVINVLKRTKEVYLSEMNITEEKFNVVEKPGENNLDIILGLKLPGMIYIIDLIVKKFRNEILRFYKNNEKSLRGILSDKKQEKVERYYQYLNVYNEIIFLELDRNILISKIIKNEYEKNEFYELFLDDYYSLFIEKNLNKDIKAINDNKNQKDEIDLTSLKKMLKLIVKLKFDDNNENNIVKNITNTINWIECYSNEIVIILQMFSKLNKIVKNLYEQIRKIIDKDQVKFEISERNPEHRSLVNKAFFIALESLLRVITSNEKIYTSLKDDSDKYFELINIDKQIHQDALLLNTSLSLYSKEVFSLQEILIIVEALFICEINSVDNLTKTIKFFSKQTNLIIKGKNSDLKSNLKKLYEFLFKNIRNNKLNYGEIMNSILWNEFIKIVYDEYRIKIIEIILENIELIPYSTKIMTYIVNNTLDHSIKGIPNNLDIIHDSKSKIIKMLNSSKKIFVDEMLINIFETKINLYFDLIQLASDEELEKHYPKFYLDRLNKEDNPTGIILDQSFYAFRKYLDYLELAALGKKRKHNSHIIKLYALTYVKIYLSKFVYFLKEKSNQLGDISEILKVIKGKKNNNFRKVIKIYIFKLFYSLLNNYEELQSFNFKDYNIDFATEFTFSKKNQAKEEDMLNFYFLPLDTMEIYQKYMQQFSQFEIARKANFPLSQVKIFADYIKTNGIDIFLAMSINKIISNLGLKIRSTKKINEYHSFSLFTQNLLDK